MAKELYQTSQWGALGMSFEHHEPPVMTSICSHSVLAYQMWWHLSLVWLPQPLLSCLVVSFRLVLLWLVLALCLDPTLPPPHHLLRSTLGFQTSTCSSIAFQDYWLSYQDQPESTNHCSSCWLLVSNHWEKVAMNWQPIASSPGCSSQLLSFQSWDAIAQILKEVLVRNFAQAYLLLFKRPPNLGCFSLSECSSSSQFLVHSQYWLCLWLF